MRMRAGGRTFALAAILAVAIVEPGLAACDDGNGCEDSAQGIAAAQAAAGAARAEEAPAPVEKPLSLVSRKGSGKTHAARKPARSSADHARSAEQAAPDRIKDARAQARDAELAKGAETDGAATETDRSPAQSSTQQSSMPAISPDEVSEIDETAPTTETPTASVAQPTPASRTEPQAAPIDDTPRLATARVELPETTTTTTASASSDESTWDKTSLIGKIFIAVGGLLTAASAVRMFIG